jgi:hypothetical protein
LACSVDETSHTHGLRVGADPGDARAIDDFGWQGHVVIC